MTATGRGIDLSYRSNRFVVALSLIAACTFGGFALWTDRFDYREAAIATIGVFLAWAIGRELDPHHPSVAAISGLATFGAAFFGIPAALVCFAALITLRLVAGTTGRWLTPIDIAVLAFVGFASGAVVWYWPIAIIAFMWLKAAPDAGPRRWWGVGTLAAGFVVGWFSGNLDAVEFTVSGLAVGIGVVVIGVVAVSSVVVDVPTDSGRGRISSRSVRLARMGACVIVVCPVLFGGEGAVWSVAPIATALAGTAIVVIGRAVRLVDRTRSHAEA